MTRTGRALAGAMLLAIGAAWAGGAFAADRIRVAKSVANPLAFTPVDVGIATGIWAKHGLDVEVSVFAGDARLQPAFVSGDVDFGLAAGTSLGFIYKGVPAKAVGVVANQPLSMAVVVGDPTKIKRPEDLKGATLGVTTNASLTYWLARELSRRMGWGPEGIKTAALGDMTAQIAALKSHQIDGFVMSASVGYTLEEKHEGSVLLSFGDYIKHFHTHIIEASDKIINEHPDQVRRFLAGWKEVIAYMFDHKAETVKIASKVEHISEELSSREYDAVMPMMSRDMRFDKDALDLIAASFPELGILPTKPNLSGTYTEKFLEPAP
jgi:NitT/TauT family transport system substrate-binding protein